MKLFVELRGDWRCALEPANVTDARDRTDAGGGVGGLAKADPGRDRTGAGVYDLALSSTNLGGTAAAPIVIESADPADPAIIRGSGSGMKFTDASYVTIRHLVFERQAEHAINIDDGDSYATPSHHITLSDLTIRDTGTHGIAAAIKMSGVQDFAIERATIVNWGTGSAITLVGAHRGVIRESLFRHADDAGATGVQMKGGSTAIVVRENRFEHASIRAVQIGGSTDDRSSARSRPQPSKRRTAPSSATSSSAPRPSSRSSTPTARRFATTRSTGRGSGCCAFCRNAPGRDSCHLAAATSPATSFITWAATSRLVPSMPARARTRRRSDSRATGGIARMIQERARNPCRPVRPTRCTDATRCS